MSLCLSMVMFSKMIFPALVFLGLKNNDCCGCCGNESCGKRFAVRSRWILCLPLLLSSKNTDFRHTHTYYSFVIINIIIKCALISYIKYILSHLLAFVVKPFLKHSPNIPCFFLNAIVSFIKICSIYNKIFCMPSITGF